LGPTWEQLGPIGTCMGTIWDLLFWDFEIYWRVRECFGTILGPVLGPVREKNANFGSSQNM
jgi:hypothetical protein